MSVLQQQDIELEIVHVDLTDKIIAVLDCLMTGGRYSIRTLKACASKKVLISDKIVSTILRYLLENRVVQLSSKRWYLADYEKAEKILRMYGARTTSTFSHLNL